PQSVDPADPKPLVDDVVVVRADRGGAERVVAVGPRIERVPHDLLVGGDVRTGVQLLGPDRPHLRRVQDGPHRAGPAHTCWITFPIFGSASPLGSRTLSA